MNKPKPKTLDERASKAVREETMRPTKKREQDLASALAQLLVVWPNADKRPGWCIRWGAACANAELELARKGYDLRLFAKDFAGFRAGFKAGRRSRK